MKKCRLISGSSVFILFSLVMLICNSHSIAAMEPHRQIDRDEGIYIDFETRLKFYLDLKTKRFLKKMSLKERLLLEMIEDVSSEIEARGASAVARGSIAFDLIYGKSDTLLKEYEAEIQSIKNIVIDLEKLERLIQRMDDLKILQEVEQLKDHLINVLDDQKLATKNLTKHQVAKMISDYSHEIDQVLRLYDQIDQFQKQASIIGDVEIIKQLDRQRQRMIKILEESRIAGPTPDRVVTSYIEEAASIVDILKKIDSLEQEAAGDSTLELDVDQAREQIVASIDKRILKLFGYVETEEFKGRTISDYFKAWKAERIAQYQVKLTNYKILRDNLIRTATPRERNRMLEREITRALLSYSDQNYDLAEMQLREIYNAYQDYYDTLDGVIFYRSEANFANNYYDAAREGYLAIIRDYPNSQYAGQCYLRLMAISYTYGWDNEFFKYFDKAKDFLTIDREDLNKAYYLAAYLRLRQNRFQDARKLLESIKDASRYYIPAQYLLGVVYANLEKYNQAKKIFESLVNRENYPWTDLNYTIFKNESLLKLGYLHYQRGEYDKATFYFDQVSKGYPGYDASLLGQAWANLKKGKYDNAINKVDLICSNYLLSNYTYEAMVLSAHCKRIQKRPDEALKSLKYVTNAKLVLNKVKQYNEERRRILKQLDELEQLENTVLEHQNKKLYPKIVRIRDLINDALQSFRYRGAVSSQLLEEYYDERKVLIRQIEQFDGIIDYAKQQGNQKLLADAIKQRNRLVSVLETYQMSPVNTGMSYFTDYPLAAKEGGIIYRRGIVRNLISDLILEKQRVQKDLQTVTRLMGLSSDQTRIDATLDLEIIEDDLRDLNNQLNQFQVWLANHNVEEVKPETERWANFSGFGISDINFVSYRERIRKIGGYQKNLALIENVLKDKKQQLEVRIRRFDDEVKKIQKEMEAEKIRLEKLEKEKYFQDIYFETKTREIETEEFENFDEINWLQSQQSGKKF